MFYNTLQERVRVADTGIEMTNIADKLREGKKQIRMLLHNARPQLSPELLDALDSILAKFPDPDAVVDIAEVGKCSDELQRVAQQRDELQEQITMRKVADAGIGTVPIGRKFLGSLHAVIKAQKETIYSLQHRCTLVEARAALAKLEEKP